MGLEILDLGNRKRHSVIPIVVRAKFIICSYQLIILIRLLENSCKIGRSLLPEFLSSEKSLGKVVEFLSFERELRNSTSMLLGIPTRNSNQRAGWYDIL